MSFLALLKQADTAKKARKAKEAWNQKDSDQIGCEESAKKAPRPKPPDLSSHLSPAENDPQPIDSSLSSLSSLFSQGELADPADWAGEYEPARGRAIRYRRHGELFNAPRLAIVPPAAGEHFFDVADWLDGQGLGPVAIIEAAPAPAREPATDHGDETEHDRWLAGTPAAELVAGR